jgi:hypothetical protein
MVMVPMVSHLGEKTLLFILLIYVFYFGPQHGQTHLGKQKVSLMLNPFKVKQQTKASQAQDKPMDFGPKPIQTTLATAVPTRVPIV